MSLSSAGSAGRLSVFALMASINKSRRPPFIKSVKTAARTAVNRAASVAIVLRVPSSSAPSEEPINLFAGSFPWISLVSTKMFFVLSVIVPLDVL